MFLGHYAVALAVKKAAPRTSLGTLAAAAVGLDLLWPVFLLVGLERLNVDPAATQFTPLDFAHYPWSHSLLMAAVWGALLGLVYYAVRNYPRGAVLVAALVVSHWLLDLPMHRPDLPLAPWGDGRFGWGIWNNVPATLAVELALFFGGTFLYVTATRSRDQIGAWGLVFFVLLLVAIFAVAAFGPPPPDSVSVAWTAHAQWLFVLLAGWIDAHRSPMRATGLGSRQ